LAAGRRAASWLVQSVTVLGFCRKIGEKFDVLALGCYCKKVPRVSGPCRRGSSTHGWVEKNPRDRKIRLLVARREPNDCVILDTRDSPQSIPDHWLFGLKCCKSAAYRNRACDTLHPGWAMRAGTAKRSRLILEIEGKTLDHRRLFTSGLLYRFTDAAGKIFVRDASAFSLFCVYGVCTAKGEV
jgi:hypothetical protein